MSVPPSSLSDQLGIALRDLHFLSNSPQSVSKFAPIALHSTAALRLPTLTAVITRLWPDEPFNLGNAIWRTISASHQGGIKRYNFSAASLTSAFSWHSTCKPLLKKPKGPNGFICHYERQIAVLWNSFPALTEQKQWLADQSSNHPLSTQPVDQLLAAAPPSQPTLTVPSHGHHPSLRHYCPKQGFPRATPFTFSIYSCLAFSSLYYLHLHILLVSISNLFSFFPD